MSNKKISDKCGNSVLIPNRNRLTRKTIDAFIAGLCILKDDSVTGESILATCNEVKLATSLAEKIRLTNKILDMFDFLEFNQKHEDEIIDYRRWKIGTVTVLGQTIGICPICGERGAIEPPYMEHFKGMTEHVIQPEGAIWKILMSCHWDKEN